MASELVVTAEDLHEAGHQTGNMLPCPIRQNYSTVTAPTVEAAIAEVVGVNLATGQKLLTVGALEIRDGRKPEGA